MTITTLNSVLDGTISVEIGRRTPQGLERVARGRLVDGRARNTGVRLVDENTNHMVEVVLTRAHTFADTPRGAV